MHNCYYYPGCCQRVNVVNLYKIKITLAYKIYSKSYIRTDHDELNNLIIYLFYSIQI